MDDVTGFNNLINKIASDTNVGIPGGYKYRYAPYECWKCHKKMIIYKWTNSLIEGNIEEPPEPIPSSVQKRYTKTSNETYWANVCPNCDSVQGDWFISIEPDSPFFGLGEIIDNKESFEVDMEQIASYYYGEQI
jgi:hypothetical protein